MSRIRETRDFRSTDIERPVRILRDTLVEGSYCEDPISVPDLLFRTTERYGDHPALAYQDAKKEWQFISYRDYKSKVEKFAKVLIKLGLKRWGCVGVLAFNSVEWFVTELGAILAG